MGVVMVWIQQRGLYFWELWDFCVSSISFTVTTCNAIVWFYLRCSCLPSSSDICLSLSLSLSLPVSLSPCLSLSLSLSLPVSLSPCLSLSLSLSLPVSLSPCLSLSLSLSLPVSLSPCLSLSLSLSLWTQIVVQKPFNIRYQRLAEICAVCP
ncbi:hypothetical protein GE09DRAFT_207887 [Coniochaeta sp. 2T2.1]|nr:hypothetical protein GE09DRAFT_207887 [Coniochaeta sp. 2T2.1]